MKTELKSAYLSNREKIIYALNSMHTKRGRLVINDSGDIYLKMLFPYECDCPQYDDWYDGEIAYSYEFNTTEPGEQLYNYILHDINSKLRHCGRCKCNHCRN